MASELESFNARGNRPKEAVVLPTAEELVEEERGAWQRFFGKETGVPEPPQELLQTLERLSELGVSGVEAHYLPKVAFKKDDNFPGWQVKPEEGFWQHIKDGKVSEDATQLSGNWVLIDGRPKPNYQDGMQMYEDDLFFLGTLIEELRTEGEVKKYGFGFDDSRFGVSWGEIRGEITPELAKALGVSQERVRVPKEIEFNVLGNIHHPEWGETNTWEWFEDKFEDDGRLCGGVSSIGGLSDVGSHWQGYFSADLGFRPLVEFPQKT